VTLAASRFFVVGAFTNNLKGRGSSRQLAAAATSSSHDAADDDVKNLDGEEALARVRLEIGAVEEEREQQRIIP
jgi:hypothetical protein